MEEQKVNHYIMVMAIIAIVAIFGILAFLISLRAPAGGAYFAPGVSVTTAPSSDDGGGGGGGGGGNYGPNCKVIEATSPSQTGSQVCNAQQRTCSFRMLKLATTSYTTVNGQQIINYVDKYISPDISDDGGCNDAYMATEGGGGGPGGSSITSSNNGLVVCCKS